MTWPRPGTQVRILESDPKAPYPHLHRGRTGVVTAPEDMVFSGTEALSVPVRLDSDDDERHEAWFTPAEVEVLR